MPSATALEHAGMLLWQIDDTPHWHAVTRASLQEHGDSTISSDHFHSGQAGLQAWDAACANGGLPDVVLMDFFLGDTLGNELTRLLRESEPEGHHACIVGHSSIIDCSEAIRAAGGDAIVRKHANDAGVNPSLLQWLHTFKA